MRPDPNLSRRCTGALARGLLQPVHAILTREHGRYPGHAFLLVLLAFLLASCSNAEKKETSGQGESDKKEETKSRVTHGTNDEVIITLDAKTQQLMGLQSAPLQPAQLRPELKSYGHVLDSSALTTLVADFVTARAAAAASDAELKRLQTLSAQNNASERALQTAQASAARDNAQVESIRLRLLANWGSAIAGRTDLPDFVRSLSSLAAVLVQLNLAGGATLGSPPNSARLLTLSDQTNLINAEVLGPAPTTDPQLQSKGFFLIVNPNASHLSIGEAVTGFLSLPGEPQTGVAVPRDAIVQFNGLNWAYLQTSDETFKRVEVPSGPPLEHAVFVQAGFKAGDKVVTVAAQQLLSEELKGQGGE